MASEHVIATIEELNNYANIVPTILSWLEKQKFNTIVIVPEIELRLQVGLSSHCSVNIYLN